MKKLFILLTTLVFSSISFASGDSSLSSLFKSPQEANITVLSQKELSEVKGGVRSPVYTCKHCTAKHGGVFSPRVCPDCYNKGYRIHTIRPIRP